VAKIVIGNLAWIFYVIHQKEEA